MRVVVVSRATKNGRARRRRRKAWEAQREKEVSLFSLPLHVAPSCFCSRSDRRFGTGKMAYRRYVTPGRMCMRRGGMGGFLSSPGGVRSDAQHPCSDRRSFVCLVPLDCGFSCGAFRDGRKERQQSQPPRTAFVLLHTTSKGADLMLLRCNVSTCFGSGRVACSGVGVKRSESEKKKKRV